MRKAGVDHLATTKLPRRSRASPPFTRPIRSPQKTVRCLRLDRRKSRQATASRRSRPRPPNQLDFCLQQIPSLYRIPSESGCPELPRGESCCTGLPGCTGVSCGPGSLNCGVIGFGTSAGTPLSPPRAGCGVDPPDRGAAHAGWVSRNTTARKANGRWTLMVNS